jgi:hypothetical protein
MCSPGDAGAAGRQAARRAFSIALFACRNDIATPAHIHLAGGLLFAACVRCLSRVTLFPGVIWRWLACFLTCSMHFCSRAMTSIRCISAASGRRLCQRRRAGSGDKQTPVACCAPGENNNTMAKDDAKTGGASGCKIAA